MHEFKDTVKDKSNEELLTMVYEFDQWSPEMLEVVEKELVKRDLLPKDINTRRQAVIEEEETILLKGKEASVTGLIVGWLTVLGLLGIYIGYNYMSSKSRSMYTGKTYFEYNEESRKNGYYLFYASLFGLFLSIIYAVLKIN